MTGIGNGVDERLRDQSHVLSDHQTSPRFSLELTSHVPALIFDDFGVEAATQHATRAKFRNDGSIHRQLGSTIARTTPSA